jgi:hypothetical protein
MSKTAAGSTASCWPTADVLLEKLPPLEPSLSRGRTSAMAMLFEAEIEREFAELARQRERLHAILSDADETA